MERAKTKFIKELGKPMNMIEYFNMIDHGTKDSIVKPSDVGKQRELDFHNSIPLKEGEGLEKAKDTAKKQQDMIMELFRENPLLNFTPIEVWDVINEERDSDMDTWGQPVLLTSVRRAISNLTKAGRLFKCDRSITREGRYGKPNRTWRYNVDYVNYLNQKP